MLYRSASDYTTSSDGIEFYMSDINSPAQIVFRVGSETLDYLAAKSKGRYSELLQERFEAFRNEIEAGAVRKFASNKTSLKDIF